MLESSCCNEDFSTEALLDEVTEKLRSIGPTTLTGEGSTEESNFELYFSFRK